MKKLIMMMAVAVGLTGFAAQNDRLISFYTEGPDTYEDGTAILDGERCALVWVKTGSVFGGFEVQNPDEYRVLEYAACALNGHFEPHVFRVAHELDLQLDPAGDYQVLVLDTRNEQKDALSELVGDAPARINDFKSGLGKTQEQVEEFENFLLPGPDRYSDGMLVREGEVYALVWMKEGTVFKGFRNAPGQNVPVLCVDEANNWFYRVYGRADAQGKCVKDDGVTLEVPQGYENGHFAIFLMDTRKPGTNELTDRDGGRLPLFLQGYCEVLHNTAVTTSGWTPVKVSEGGKAFSFDPSLALANGFAAVYSYENGKDVWTVREMPKAWAELQESNTVFETENDLCVLRAPAKPLVFPCTNEVDYVFNVAESNDMRRLIAKIVSTKGLLQAILTMKSEADLVPYLDVLDAQDIELLKGGALKAWADKVMPFFQWNADFAVSFDRGVTNGTVFLDGQYDGAAKWGFNTWVGSAFANDLAAGEEIRLLKQGYQEVYLNYSEICTNVIQFKCGAMNLSSNNWGTTMTVKLRLYENTGRCNETKSSFTVDTYKYTFKGPLNVRFYSNDVEFVELAISTNHDGRSEFPLPAYHADSDVLAFTGWSNAVDNTIWGSVPVRTWADADHPISLYATFKPAQTVQIAPTSGAEKVAFKVTDEWLQSNKIDTTSTETMASNLEERVNSKSDLTYWQTYLLGIKPDANAELKVEKTNGNEDDKALVVSTVQVVAPDAGIKVGYSLDKVDAKEDVKTPGVEQVTKDLKIDLEPQDDTPTGYYKMNVIFTPTENGEEGEKITIPADNTIGVLKVETQEPVVPVAVPWSSLEDGTDIPVNEIVKTSTLSEGDLMHVYDQDQKAYVNLKLDANGEWTPVKAYKLDDVGKVTDTTISIDKIDAKKVTRGSSVWLERKDTSKPFYLIGQYKKGSHATTQIKTKADGAVKPEANLIAPPGIKDTDLNEVVNKDIGEKDQLMIVKEGVPTYFQRKNDKWSYPKQVYTVDEKGRARTTTTWVDNEAVVPAGLGLWYLSDSGTPKIAWPEPTDEQGENK